MLVRNFDYQTGEYAKEYQIWNVNIFTMVSTELQKILRKINKEVRNIHYIWNILIVKNEHDGSIIAAPLAKLKEDEPMIPNGIIIPYEEFHMESGIWKSEESKEDFMKHNKIVACIDKLVHVEDVTCPNNFNPHPLNKCLGEISQEFAKVLHESIKDFKPINSKKEE